MPRSVVCATPAGALLPTLPRVALVALALAASAPRAAAFAYEPLTGAANPLDGVDVGGFSTPGFADLDDDGDPDFVAGERNGAFFYFENTGTPASPAFTARTGAESPFTGLGTTEYSWPAFADLDGDLDPDLVSGAHYDPLRYFENTGSAAAPVFVERSGGANPFAGLGVGNNATPALADVDADGDADLVTGDASGVLRWFENTGSAASAVFVERSGAANPLGGFDFGSFVSAALADPDGDGDLDCAVGLSNGSFAWLENVGTAESAAFVERAGEESPLDGQSAGTFAAATFADLDADAVPELVSGNGAGQFRVFAPEPARGAAAALALAALRALAGSRARRRPRGYCEVALARARRSASA